MLTRLDFQIFDRDEEADQYGSHYEHDRDVVDGIECDVIFNVVDTTHPIWKTSFKDDKVERFMPIAYIAEIIPGVYQTSGFNFHNDIESLTDFEESRNRELCNTLLCSDGNYRSQYGVAANIDEVITYYKDVLESDIPFVISYSYVHKKHQSEDGGWRWHKWGPMISKNLVPTTEYLYDEPYIDKVICFHLYILEQKKA